MVGSAQNFAVLFNGTDAGSFMGSMYSSGIDAFAHPGETFWVASDQEDADFSRAVSILTNSRLVFVWTKVSYGGAPDSFWQFHSQPDLMAEKLRNYNVSRIGLTMTSAVETYDPNAAEPWTYSLAITCTLEGTPVPEPVPVLGLVYSITGLFTIERWRSRRSRRS